MSPAAPEWQRLAGLALVFIIGSRLQKTVRENLFLFAGAGAGAAFTDWLGAREVGLLVLVVLLLSVLGGMVYHRRFRFCLEDDAVRVRRGLIEQKELRVRFARVQNIQIGQPFYFRPFGLVRFSLQTPGSAQAEVELPGIPRELALHMRDRISQLRAEAPAPESPTLENADAQAGTDVEASDAYRAGPLRLFQHGVSSNQVWVLAGFLVYVLSQLMDRLLERLDALLEAGTISLAWGWWWLPGLLVLLIGALFLLSGLLAMVRFHDYRLRDLGDRLVAISGLFDRREQTLRREKITGLMLTQSAVGRVLGCWSLTAHQTGMGEVGPEAGRSSFLIPGLCSGDLGLSARVLPGFDVPAEFQGVSARLRLFLWSRLLLVSLLSLAILAALLGPHHPLLLALAGATALCLPLMHWRFRCWGWALHASRLWVRRGLLGQRLDVFDLARVQQVWVVSSPYLRRHELANLSLVLPHGPITLPFVPHELAVELANRALHAAETARVHQV